MGVTEAEKKLFAALLEDARHERDKDPQSPDQRLHNARRRVADALGNYRAAASLYSNGAQGRDAMLERDLRVSGVFPRTDTQLKKALTGLDVVMRSTPGRSPPAGSPRRTRRASSRTPRPSSSSSTPAARSAARPRRPGSRARPSSTGSAG